MKRAKKIDNELLAYIVYNPIFRASRMASKKLKRQLLRFARPRLAASH